MNNLNFLIANCVRYENNKTVEEIEQNIQKLKVLQLSNDLSIIQKNACIRGINLLEKEKIKLYEY